jgi:crossover junction endodeoxyribonuclease RuvC
MNYIGIDPGLSGAVVVIDDDQYITFYDTPTFTVKSGKKNKRHYNIVSMADIITYHSEGAQVVLEKVHAMPGQGVSSMFTMGEGLGIWKGIVTALKLPLTMVPPQTWKKVMMEGMGREKEASLIRALQLFPNYGHMLSRKKDVDRADALLMAEWLRRRQ